MFNFGVVSLVYLNLPIPSGRLKLVMAPKIASDLTINAKIGDFRGDN